MPPWVRNRARAVSVCSSSISSARSAAVTLNDTKQAAGGAGWRFPLRGTVERGRRQPGRGLGGDRVLELTVGLKRSREPC